MSVSISEIIAGASVHAVPLAGECAGYLVLAAADQAAAAPRRIDPADVRLFDDGTVRVEGARAAAELDSEGDLRALLDVLLLTASSTTPALVRASRRAPGRGLAALVREIETALIPVNRSAAHRALARLERETERARHAGRLDGVQARAVTRPVTPAPKAVEPPAPPPAPPELDIARDLPELADDIPSLFAPPVTSVEAIAALAAEIETRPEPVVARKSAAPPAPAKTPSPPPLPVTRRSSPPPLPVAERSPLPPVAERSPLPPVVERSPLPPVVEAQPTTPVLGTCVESYSDDEMGIEVVFDDELMTDALMSDELADEELTGVLVRSAPLEVAAMNDASSSPPPEATAAPDPTDPCPPAIEDEPSLVANDEPAVTASEEPAVAANDEPAVAASEEPAVAASEEPAVAASEEPAVAASEEPAVAASEEPAVAVSDTPPPIEFVGPETTQLLVETAEKTPPEIPSDAISAEAPQVPNVADDTSEPFATETRDPHEETLALALSVHLVAQPEPAPVARIPMPKPRPSDVEDLLERMTQENVSGDELRSSLKGMAGLDPTPPPPET